MPKLKTGKTLCTCYSKVYTRQDKLGTCGEFVHEFVRAVGGRGKGIPQIMTYTVNNLSPLQAHYFKGSLHKLRLHFLAFDHVPTPPSLQFLCSKSSVFLTTYPPPNANIICEGSLSDQVVQKLTLEKKQLFKLIFSNEKKNSKNSSNF